jgi:hypothetical protein
MQIKREKEHEGFMQVLPWMLVILLAAVLAVKVMRANGIVSHCNPDLVMGGCDSE